MGYWSDHPMAGDPPCDLRDELLKRFDVGGGDDIVYYFELPDAQIKKHIQDNLESLLIEAERTNNFTFPWILFDYDTEIPLEFRDRIKSLIGDGGGAERGYQGDEVSSPQSHCRILEANFDRYCDNFIDYADEVGCHDLMDSIIDLLLGNDKTS